MKQRQLTCRSVIDGESISIYQSKWLTKNFPNSFKGFQAYKNGRSFILWFTKFVDMPYFKSCMENVVDFAQMQANRSTEKTIFNIMDSVRIFMQKNKFDMSCSPAIVAVAVIELLKWAMPLSVPDDDGSHHDKVKPLLMIDNTDDWMNVLATPMGNSQSVKKRQLMESKPVKIIATPKGKSKPKAKSVRKEPAVMPALMDQDADSQPTIWFGDMVNAITFSTNLTTNEFSRNISASQLQVLHHSIRTALLFAFTANVTVNGTAYTKWTGIRAYIQKFVGTVFEEKDAEEGGSQRSQFPCDPAGLRAHIASITPEPEEPSDDDADSSGSESFTVAEHQKVFGALATQENIDAVRKLQESVVGKPVRFQAEALVMVTKFWEECKSVTSYDGFAKALLSGMSLVVAADVWQLCVMALNESSITSKLSENKVFDDVAAAKALLQLRSEYAIYLLKSLTECEQNEWPLPTNSHVVQVSLSRFLFVVCVCVFVSVYVCVCVFICILLQATYDAIWVEGHCHFFGLHAHGRDMDQHVVIPLLQCKWETGCRHGAGSQYDTGQAAQVLRVRKLFQIDMKIIFMNHVFVFFHNSKDLPSMLPTLVQPL